MAQNKNSKKLVGLSAEKSISGPDILKSEGKAADINQDNRPLQKISLASTDVFGHLQPSENTVPIHLLPQEDSHLDELLNDPKLSSGFKNAVKKQFDSDNAILNATNDVKGLDLERFCPLFQYLENELFSKNFNKQDFLYMLTKFFATCFDFNIEQAGINGTDARGNAPVHLLCSSYPLLKALVTEYNADINQLTASGENVALCAAEGGFAESFKYAIAQGNSLNHVNNKGYNVLHIIAEKTPYTKDGASQEIVEYALANKVSLHAKNDSEKTPIDLITTRLSLNPGDQALAHLQTLFENELKNQELSFVDKIKEKLINISE